jgi:hypothetical protein
MVLESAEVGKGLTELTEARGAENVGELSPGERLPSGESGR